MAQQAFDDTFDPPQTKDDLANELDLAERAQLWIDRIREVALDRLKHQERIPGWGLVPTRPMQKWIDEDQARPVLVQNFGPGVVETKLRSPAQVEKLVGRSNQTAQAFIEPLVERVSSGVKLARTTSAQEDFSDVDF
jgi:hypothetical protein